MKMQWQCSPSPGSAVAVYNPVYKSFRKIHLNGNRLIFQHYFNLKSVRILYAFVLLSVNFLCYLFGEIY